MKRDATSGTPEYDLSFGDGKGYIRGLFTYSGAGTFFGPIITYLEKYFEDNENPIEIEIALVSYSTLVELEFRRLFDVCETYRKRGQAIKIRYVVPEGWDKIKSDAERYKLNYEDLIEIVTVLTLDPAELFPSD